MHTILLCFNASRINKSPTFQFTVGTLTTENGRNVLKNAKEEPKAEVGAALTLNLNIKEMTVKGKPLKLWAVMNNFVHVIH